MNKTRFGNGIRLLSILLTAAVILLQPDAAQSQGSTVMKLIRVSPADSTGCLLDVSVDLENVENMTAFSVRLTFEATVAQVVEVRNGDFLVDEVPAPDNGFDNAVGTVKFDMALFKDNEYDLPESGSGELVHLRVLALQANTSMGMAIDGEETKLVEAETNDPIEFSIEEALISTGSCEAQRVFLPLIKR